MCYAVWMCFVMSVKMCSSWDATQVSEKYESEIKVRLHTSSSVFTKAQDTQLVTKMFSKVIVTLHHF